MISITKLGSYRYLVSHIPREVYLFKATVADQCDIPRFTLSDQTLLASILCNLQSDIDRQTIEVNRPENKKMSQTRIEYSHVHRWCIVCQYSITLYFHFWPCLKRIYPGYNSTVYFDLYPLPSSTGVLGILRTGMSYTPYARPTD